MFRHINNSGIAENLYAFSISYAPRSYFIVALDWGIHSFEFKKSLGK